MHHSGQMLFCMSIRCMTYWQSLVGKFIYLLICAVTCSQWSGTRIRKLT